MQSLELAGALVTILFGIIGFLLQKKDSQQEQSMKKLGELLNQEATTLWRKHDEDAARLHVLEIELARSYYVKTEVDNRFHELERILKTGLGEVRDEVKAVNIILMQVLQNQSQIQSQNQANRERNDQHGN